MAREKENANIPILGIDQRPLERQATPGLCSDISSLRPRGPKKDPYWEVVADPGNLQNASGTAFSHAKQDQIVAAHWQIRSRVGQESADPNGSLERLLIGFDDGTLEIVDPDKGAGWETVTTKDFGSPGATWSYSFTNINDLVVVSASKDGDPEALLHLQDDTFSEVNYPQLPELKIYPTPVGFSSAEVTAGDFNGIDPGWYAMRYGYRTSGGDIIRPTRPIPFRISDFTLSGSDETTWYLAVILADVAPDITSWEDIITGIDIYLSEKRDTKEELFDAVFYQIASIRSWEFSTLPKEVGSTDVYSEPGDEVPAVEDELEAGDEVDNQHNLITLFTGKTADISTNEVMEVDAFTHQDILARRAFSYNSRLILGDTKTKFRSPFLLYEQSTPLVLLESVDMDTSDGGSTWDARFLFRSVLGTVFSDSVPPTVTHNGPATDPPDVTVTEGANGLEVIFHMPGDATTEVRITGNIYGYAGDRTTLYQVGEFAYDDEEQFILTTPP